MGDTSAAVHLKRAYGFVQEVQKATQDFRDQVIRHSDQIDSDQPFLAGMLSAYKGSRQLKQQKAALVSDLQLANQEIDQAASMDGNSAIEVDGNSFGVLNLRALVTYLNGQIEMLWGRSDQAKHLMNSSLQIVEFADAHYMLGLIHEDEYNPSEALKHFEKCLEIDPDGEFSVSALREANAMRNYKKKFRGNWLFLILLLFVPFPPFLWSIVYFFVKRK